jgi:heterodisulfide reductase subunit C
MSAGAKRRDAEIAEEMLSGVAEQIRACMQCGTCTATCPMADAMDHGPRKLFALLLAGERGVVLASSTPWFCSSCYTCTVRCPQEIPITEVMYHLKEAALKARVAPNDNRQVRMNRAFVEVVEKYGRSFDALVLRETVAMDARSEAAAIPLGIRLGVRGRVGLRPSKFHGRSQVKKVLEALERDEVK